MHVEAGVKIPVVDCRSSGLRQILFIIFCLASAFGQESTTPATGTLNGTVTDASGAVVSGAKLALEIAASPQRRNTNSDADGAFAFSGLPAGKYKLTVTAEGFSARSINGELHPGETVIVPAVSLAVATVNTEVNVTQTREEIAEAQIRIQETQRVFGVIPNYFVTYDPTAVPLDTRQKFELTWKSFLDPSAFVINGIVAGIWQAQNTYKGFGQGADGYAKRYGAAYADYATGLVIGSVVTPTIFKQDPRYFYKGTGTTKQRTWYAINRSLICRGDNGKWQFCYSGLVANFASGFITNYYYPASDRNSNAVIVENGFIGIAGGAAGNLFQEFLIKKLTKMKH